MNKNHFKISEFNITGGDIPEKIADAILLHHIVPMNPIREKHGQPIYVSERSGYRPSWYEVRKGRSGKSQHCFANGKGAADYTSDNLQGLVNLLIMDSPYTRICFYKKQNFVHCDYKVEGIRQYFEDNGNGWEFIRNI